MGKKCDLSVFDRGMIVGARQGDLSISETADLLGFSENGLRSLQKTSSEYQFCGQKRVVI